LPSHAFEELSSSSALLNQKNSTPTVENLTEVGKTPLTHSGNFTRSWKNSTSTVENLPKNWKVPLPRWKIENQTNIVWTTYPWFFFILRDQKNVFQTTPPKYSFEKRRGEKKLSDLKFDEKNTNGQKSTKQNLIDRNTLLLSVTEYIIYALQCQFCELFCWLYCVCMYVCLCAYL